MIVIHLARKPLSEPSVASNVLEWGTGGINVDGCRVGTHKEVPASMPTDRSGHGIFGAFDTHGGGAGQDPNVGRWPANLILEHRKRCRSVGQKQIRDPSGPVTGREPSKTTENVYGTWRRAPYEGGDTETVEDYLCADDCPVADLDAQSGKSTASGGPIRQNGGSWKCSYQTGVYDRICDSGGASRFFKQVEPDQEFRRSHHLAICPECGKTAIDHPTDGKLPFMNVLCDGTRVKL